MNRACIYNVCERSNNWRIGNMWTATSRQSWFLFFVPGIKSIHREIMPNYLFLHGRRWLGSITACHLFLSSASRLPSLQLQERRALQSFSASRRGKQAKMKHSAWMRRGALGSIWSRTFVALSAGAGRRGARRIEARVLQSAERGTASGLFI